MTESQSKSFIRNWPLAEDAAPRGVLLLVHGLGEHIGRYDAVAKYLNALGFIVRGYDHYGHGQSTGARGDLLHPNQLVDELAVIVDGARVDFGANLPLILLGHSMGGAVAGSFIARGLRPVDGLVMSSPALAVSLSGFQKFLLNIMPKILPHLSVTNGINPRKICTDQALVMAYMNDPLVHNHVTPIEGRFILDAGMETRAAAASWSTPTLLLYAGKDYLVNRKGSEEFAAAAPQAMVQAKCYEQMYHEIFNERDKRIVFSDLEEWLKRY